MGTESAGSRGLRALDKAHAAFDALPDDYLGEVARNAVSLSRASLRGAAFAALYVASVTRRPRRQSQEPYTAGFVQDSAVPV